MNDQSVEFHLPYPPSGNHLWKHTKAGGHYITPKAEQYYRIVHVEAIRQKANLQMDGRLGVRCAIWPPDKRRRDMDNAWKVISDACTRAGVWLDDNQIDELTLLRVKDSRAKGIVSIRVWVLDQGVAESA